MKLIFIIFMWTLYLSGDISLPDNFQTKFNQTIINNKGKEIRYSGMVTFKQDIELFTNRFQSRNMR